MRISDWSSDVCSSDLLTAFGQAMSGLFVSDEVVKGSMASYTFEHMEISAYRSLIAAAEAVGDQQTKQVCKEILAEEEAMASWLGEHLALVTSRFLEMGSDERREGKECVSTCRSWWSTYL